MSARFEVLHNGKRVCVSGIDGGGVLSATVDYVKRANNDPTYKMRVGGLGHFHPTLQQSQHVSWPAPDIGVGDEITIRVLPPGDFEAPEGMKPDPSASIDDPLFGHLDYNINALDGTVPFDFAPFKSAHVHMVASDSGPSESQRTLFQDFITRHNTLWPRIADALVRCHTEISSVDELVNRIDSRICIDMNDDLNTLTISYSMTGGSEYSPYIVTIRDWEIAEICSAK